MKYYKIIPRMGISLNGLLGPKILSSTIIQPALFHQVKIIPCSFKSFTACWSKIQPFSISIYRNTPHPFLRNNPFPISFCTPVVASPDKAPTLKAGKTVSVRNGINPANAGKNPHSIFMLYANCVFYIFIVMSFSSSYASTSLSICDLLKATTSSPCRSENVRRIVIDSQLDSNAFLSLYFDPLIFAF